jgi:hypothetical protein
VERYTEKIAKIDAVLKQAEPESKNI